jgi:hypothetical protein
MKSFIAVTGAALLATGALAQTPLNSHNPAIKNGAPAPVSAPASGANSFTENQAKGRLMKAGYGSVGALAKDEHGVWRGTATKGGKKVDVGVDYKGNVTAG